jgi:hypothetical protein
MVIEALRIADLQPHPIVYVGLKVENLRGKNTTDFFYPPILVLAPRPMRAIHVHPNAGRNLQTS